MVTGLVGTVSGRAGSGGGPAGGGPDVIDVLTVNDPRMVDRQQLTEQDFTADGLFPARVCAAGFVVSLPVLIAGLAALDKLVPAGRSMGVVK